MPAHTGTWKHRRNDAVSNQIRAFVTVCVWLDMTTMVKAVYKLIVGIVGGGQVVCVMCHVRECCIQAHIIGENV